MFISNLMNIKLNTKGEFIMVYGYARISRPTQNIERQIRNIKDCDNTAIIIREAYTGTTQDRPEWLKLLKHIKIGDTIIFDSVSRMSRNADEGFFEYERLFNLGINLIFLKERYINTETYKQAITHSIKLTGNEIADEYIKATNKVLMILAKQQIKLAFEQSEKEVTDLQQRTKEGIETARLNGKQIGQRQGAKLKIKKAKPAKEIILKHNKDFNGNLNDIECIKLTGLSRNTYYKYKKELKKQINN